MTIGWSDGTYYFGGGLNTNANNPTWSLQTKIYGTNIGTTMSGNWGLTGKSTGLTDDPDKSGIVVDFSSETITCNYIIKY